MQGEPNAPGFMYLTTYSMLTHLPYNMGRVTFIQFSWMTLPDPETAEVAPRPRRTEVNEKTTRPGVLGVPGTSERIVCTFCQDMSCTRPFLCLSYYPIDCLHLLGCEDTVFPPIEVNDLSVGWMRSALLARTRLLEKPSRRVGWVARRIVAGDLDRKLLRECVIASTELKLT